MLKKKWLCLALTGVLALSFGALAACGEKPSTGGDELKPVVLPVDDNFRTTKGVAVHDPSIFQDPKDGKYYAFGSHYAVASSTDLIEWEQVAKDDEKGTSTKLFGDGGVKAAMPKTIAKANNNADAWAPDVEYYNGKYYMYISFTTAMYTNTSVIARVESDNVLGPYGNEVMLVDSIGVNDANKPNCIDPELFYDKEGKLWMVYGSFFGGIYMKELYNSGENWGLPKEEGNHNWGKLVWKDGTDAGVEGPYVFYNAETDYYYLMTSEADLLKDYNMHIARSKSPDGPYVDCTGADVAGKGAGNKLAGNYHFARQGSDGGYAAMGHNSVIKDASGRYFVICHVRRMAGANSVTGAHTLNVFQLYFNEDGWPVMSPTAYVGEKLGIVKEAQIANDYEVVLHSVTSDVPAVESVDYSFEAGGVITKGGTEVGSWALKDNYYVTVTIDNVEYKGVVAPGWDIYKSPQSEADGALVITAVSDKGRSLWAIAKY